MMSISITLLTYMNKILTSKILQWFIVVLVLTVLRITVPPPITWFATTKVVNRKHEVNRAARKYHVPRRTLSRYLFYLLIPQYQIVH